MFEKEAEEYSNNWKINKNNDLNFAELVELRAVIYKANKDGAEFGYNKANEWHYVKDGDLPKEENEYLVYKIDGYGCKSIQVMQFNNQHCWCANCQNEIIAWKEIVFPKEIE